ncbi:MAG: amidase [Thermoguttaceae bacterium]|nr:amidase [Thermoguttaceae bacterium]MDW8039740.1 amidase [Thermoguttaceae bacterium]
MKRWTIAEAAGALRRGELSVPELVESCLERIRRYDHQVEAWVMVDEAGALQAARAAQQQLEQGQDQGPLHGIPVGIKDIFDVAGWPTKAGSPLREGHRADQDALLVAALRRAGAILLGKTVTVEFACFDPPPTRNPWSPTLSHTPGGSSSGSAAAVAMGMCLAALGTQTGGSLIRPAAYCGIAALKPTFGQLPLEGVVPVSWRLDHAGPMALCVEDLWLMYQVLRTAKQEVSGPQQFTVPNRPPWKQKLLFSEAAEAVQRNLFAPQQLSSSEPGLEKPCSQQSVEQGPYGEKRGLLPPLASTQADSHQTPIEELQSWYLKVLDRPPRLAQVHGFFADQADSIIQRLFDQALHKLAKAGAQIGRWDWPAEFADVLDLHTQIMAVEAALYHRTSFLQHRNQYGPKITELLDLGLRIPAVEYLSAVDRLLCLRHQAADWLGNWDALIMPSTTTTAPANLQTTGDKTMQAPWSCAGLPVVAIPCGLGEDGMPGGVQLIGPPHQEEALLAVAGWCEKQFAFHHQPPLLQKE